MGSWNGTCGISQLPIHSDNDVMVYFIVQNKYKQGGADYCYSTGYWNPIGFPFAAKYNDYGSFEVVGKSSPYLNWNIKYIKDNLVEVPLGSNKYHDIAISKDKLDLDLIRSGIHEGRLSIYQDTLYDFDDKFGYKQKMVSYPVGQFMIHKHIWDIFSKFNGEAWCKKRFEKSFKSLRDANTANIKKSQIDPKIWGIGSQISNLFGSEFTMSHLGVQQFYENKMILDVYDYDLLYQILCIDGSMSQLRKGYVPQTGSGSQSEGYREFKKLNKAIAEIIKTQEKEYQ